MYSDARPVASVNTAGLVFQIVITKPSGYAIDISTLGLAAAAPASLGASLVCIEGFDDSAKFVMGVETPIDALISRLGFEILLLHDGISKPIDD